MRAALESFQVVWVLDFEFIAKDGYNPVPVCLVAREIYSKTTLRHWQRELSRPPFDLTCPSNLFVAYFASVEWNCLLALGWPLPACCIDLYAEFRCMTNNRVIPAGNGLLGAAAFFGLSAITGEEKSEYGVYDGTTFKRAQFERYLVDHDIPWPRLPSGSLALDDDTFKDMVRAYPVLAPLRELRIALGQMRLLSLTVGVDGRNRCLLSPFKSITGRSQPSNARFIFGSATWLRSLIKPPPGYGLAYVDWSQQEFGIAAALSGDQRMQEAYRSGDPYLAFAVQAGTVPTDATKVSHKRERDQFKACILGVQYGMGPESLARRIGRPPVYARHLLDLHRRTYRRFWQWSDGVENYALLHGRLVTVFGWQCHYGPWAKNINPRSIRNFPMQANGAEMLRLATCLATEAGVEVSAPVHDALLIVSPLDELDDAILNTRQAMHEASKIVLDGFALETDADIVRYPDRYRDERGEMMWEKVWELLYGATEVVT